MGEDEDDAGQRFLSPCCNSLKGNLGYALEGPMRKLVRCKACGFIMQENELREKCPACGAPKTVFEPYTDTVGEKRRRLLDMDLHPMMVHFPTSFIVAILLQTMAGLRLGQPIGRGVRLRWRRVFRNTAYFPGFQSLGFRRTFCRFFCFHGNDSLQTANCRPAVS